MVPPGPEPSHIGMTGRYRECRHAPDSQFCASAQVQALAKRATQNEPSACAWHWLDDRAELARAEYTLARAYVPGMPFGGGRSGRPGAYVRQRHSWRTSPAYQPEAGTA